MVCSSRKAAFVAQRTTRCTYSAIWNTPLILESRRRRSFGGYWHYYINDDFLFGSSSIFSSQCSCCALLRIFYCNSHRRDVGCIDSRRNACCAFLFLCCHTSLLPKYSIYVWMYFILCTPSPAACSLRCCVCDTAAILYLFTRASWLTNTHSNRISLIEQAVHVFYDCCFMPGFLIACCFRVCSCL